MTSIVAVPGLNLLNPYVKHTFMPFYFKGHIKLLLGLLAKIKCSIKGHIKKRRPVIGTRFDLHNVVIPFPSSL